MSYDGVQCSRPPSTIDVSYLLFALPSSNAVGVRFCIEECVRLSPHLFSSHTLNVTTSPGNNNSDDGGGGGGGNVDFTVQRFSTFKYRTLNHTLTGVSISLVSVSVCVFGNRLTISSFSLFANRRVRVTKSTLHRQESSIAENEKKNKLSTQSTRERQRPSESSSLSGFRLSHTNNISWWR